MNAEGWKSVTPPIDTQFLAPVAATKFRNFDCNFIEFTKSYNNGRYGFLEGVNDK